MKNQLSIVRAASLVASLFVFAVGGPVSAQTGPITYGTLDNFDVINDTLGECHGFEIELEGITIADVAYTFGAPYQRYGDPTVVATPSGTGVIIRYAATYTGTWSATTPIAVAPYPPTQGHSCWTGGDPNYLASGCDHFGASLNATPTKTTYRWLVENAGAPGTLTAFGSNVPLPAPVWKVTPPADPAVNQPVAAVAIAPPTPTDPDKCGDALWAKVYVTELPNGLHAEDLDHMVIDDPVVNIVPNEPIEVEWEWFLLQTCPGGVDPEFGGGAEVAAGNEAVSRRFEFYKYTGQYDPDPGGIKEALCDNPLAPDQQVPERCGAPNAEGVAGVGDLIGAQNAAINLAGPVVVVPENHPPVANADGANTDEDTPLTISPATLLVNDIDIDGDTLTIQSVQGATGGIVALAGGNVVFTPAKDFNGAGGFSYTIDDGYYLSTATVSVAVKPVNDPPLANAGLAQTVRVRDIVTLDGSGSTDVDAGDVLTYRWSLTTVPAHSKAALSAPTSAHPTFMADKEGNYVAQLIVNDGTMDSAPVAVTITAVKGKR